MKYKDRKNTNSVKTDMLEKRFGRSDLIPLWVADADFESPECVREALRKIVDEGVFGYNTIPDDYYPSIMKWLETMQGWKVKREWLSFIPGIVKGIGLAVNFFTGPGDGIIVQPPIYPPFMNVPLGNGRKLIFNPLKKVSLNDGTYEYVMDFDDLQKSVRSKKCRMLILSNPHNPGGISWKREDLLRLAGICYENGIIVISDEIHADMPLFGASHIPFASVSAEAASTSITFGAPSKTFNIAGIVSSYTVIPSETLREPFFHWLYANEFNDPTIFSTSSAIAAYEHGVAWRSDFISVIEKNILFAEDYCRSNFSIHNPDGSVAGQWIFPVRPQASFLVWLDCSLLYEKKFGGNQKSMVSFFVNECRLAMNDGRTFGPGGDGYMRLNVATSLNNINEAFLRISKALDKL
ncbi:MAG: PatB family C-S lyase [Bacteroidales bacterium]|jgi:cystathionine beta-lyase|nr:PatB family C-S lyase [Bacteroidales bacterium]